MANEGRDGIERIEYRKLRENQKDATGTDFLGGSRIRVVAHLGRAGINSARWNQF